MTDAGRLQPVGVVGEPHASVTRAFRVSNPPKFSIDYDGANLYIALAQSRTCLWVSADPSNGEEIGKVTGANPSGRFSGQPPTRGHLEATTVRAFLVLFRSSKDRGY